MLVKRRVTPLWLQSNPTRGSKCPSRSDFVMVPSMSEMTNLHQPTCVDSQHFRYLGRLKWVGDTQPKVRIPDNPSQASRLLPIYCQTAVSRAGAQQCWVRSCPYQGSANLENTAGSAVQHIKLLAMQVCCRPSVYCAIGFTQLHTRRLLNAYVALA